MCIQKAGDKFLYLDDLSDFELFDGIDNAIKNISSHADILFFEKIDKDKYNDLILDVILMASYYESYFNENCDFLLKQISKAETFNKKEKRKSDGCYTTPTYIAEYICKQTIEPLIRNKIGKVFYPSREVKDLYRYKINIDEIFQLKICDPAMGGVIFLICAHDLLVGILEDMGIPPEESARKLVKCLFGVDVNNNMVEISKILLNLNVMKWEMRPKIREFVLSVV